MAICSKCGGEINDNADVCLHCGGFVNAVPSGKNDTGGFGWGVLGFFLPMVGFTLWLAWKDYLPKRAKKLGIGAIVSAIASIGFLVIYYAILAVTFAISMLGAM